MSFDLDESPATTPPRNTGGGWRLFVSVADQGVVSLVTFLTGMLTARAAGSERSEVALYYLALTLFIAIGEVGNSVVSTPHMLKSPRLSGSRLVRFNGSMLEIQVAVSLALAFLVLIASLVAWLAGSHDNAFMLFLTGLCAIPVSMRGFIRNLLFARRDVVGALSLDVGVSAVQLGSVALLYAMNMLDWWHALLAVGAANLVGSVGFFALARQMFRVNRLRAIVEAKRSWSEGKWLLASSMVWTAGIYLYPWVVYAMSGGDQAGIWGVCWQLASVGNPLVMAVQNVLGPQIAYAYVHLTRVQFRFYVLKSTMLFGLAVLVLAVMMALLCEWLLTNLFGPTYAPSADVAALLVFTPVFFAISFGVSRGLFSLGHARVDLFANITPLITLFVVGIYASRHFGAYGAAIAMLVGLVLGGAYRMVAFLRISSKHNSTPAVEVLA